MSTISYPSQVNSDLWTSQAAGGGGFTSSLQDILLNGLSRSVDGAINKKFTPTAPDVQGSSRGGLGSYSAGQTAGFLNSPNAGLFLLAGGAALLLFLILR